MPAPANDNFANAIVITGTSGTATANNVSATTEVGEPELASVGKTVWYKWVAPASGTIYFDTLASGAPVTDTCLGAYTGVAVNALTEIAFNNDGGAGSLSLMSFVAVSGTTYYIQVGTFGGAEEGDIALRWFTGTAAPTGICAPVPWNSMVLHPARVRGFDFNYPDVAISDLAFTTQFPEAAGPDTYDDTVLFNGHATGIANSDDINQFPFPGGAGVGVPVVWTKMCWQPIGAPGPGDLNYEGLKVGFTGMVGDSFYKPVYTAAVAVPANDHFGTMTNGAQTDAPFPQSGFATPSISFIVCNDTTVVAGVSRGRARLYVDGVLVKTEIDLSRVVTTYDKIHSDAIELVHGMNMGLFEWVPCDCPFSGLSPVPELCGTSQWGGVTAFRHTLQGGSMRTLVSLGGQPKGRYKGWRPIGQKPLPKLPISIPFDPSVPPFDPGTGGAPPGGGGGGSSSAHALTEITPIAAAAFTDTGIQIPASVVVESVSVRVVTAIPTAATFTVGIAGNPSKFNTAPVSTVAGSVDAGTNAGDYLNTTAIAVRITPNVSPATATGQVRVTITYRSSSTAAAPASDLSFFMS